MRAKWEDGRSLVPSFPFCLSFVVETMQKLARVTYILDMLVISIEEFDRTSKGSRHLWGRDCFLTPLGL